MYKKLLISAVVLVAIVFSFNVCLANDGLKDAADGVRNVVGDAENAVEGAAKDISNASKNATGDIEKGANNVGNDIKNTANSTMDNAKKDFTGTTNNDYMATRTSTAATTENTFMGMNATAWTWLILGIAAIAIIALVWYYSAQFTSSRHNDQD